jgi:hypothetical protein
MIEGNLNTTNLLLGIMAAVSVLQALLLVAVGVMAWKLYGRTLDVVRGIEERQVAPLMSRVHGMMGTVDTILVDVKGITSRVGAQTHRVDSAISSTIDRVDETAGRVRHTVADRVTRVLGLVNGVRAAVAHVFNGNTRATTT